MGVFLTDFGLARILDGEASRYTRSGDALGTPAYMSPEQARGETATLTPATDVWALGAVLFECLAGRPLFVGDTPAAVVGAMLTTDPPDLQTVRPDLPADVARVVRGCLVRAADRRDPSARASLRWRRADGSRRSPPLWASPASRSRALRWRAPT